MRRSIYINGYNGFGPYENTLEMVKNAGFKSIALNLNADSCLKPDFKDYIKSLREELDKNEMLCSQVHLPYYNLLKSSTIIEDDMEKAINNAVVATSILGAEWATFHPRTAISEGYDWKISFENNKEALKPLLETAKKCGVGIAVENIPIFPDCPTHRFYTSDPDDLCELVDYFNCENVGVCWDAGHANLMSFDQPRVIKKVGSRIKITHLHSNYKEQDWHLLPLFGYIDYPKIMQALKETGYSGDFCLEIANVNYKAAANFYKTAFDSATILKDMFEQ